MSEKLIFLNRSFVPENTASFSVFDRGLLYGDGLFETVRIYGGKFFRLGAHLRRMFDGAKVLGIKIPYTHDEMEIFTRELAMTNQILDGFARIVLSRGEGYLGFSPHGCTTPHVVICARERQVAFRSKETWRLTFHKRAVAPLPLKSLSYLPHILAKKQAEDDGFDDAIVFDAAGTAIECTGSNLFLWKDGRLITPPLSTGCLPGITRAEIIKVARKEKIHVVEKKFGAKECRKADGIFITNSLMEVVPCHLGKKINTDILAQTNELAASFAYYRSEAVL